MESKLVHLFDAIFNSQLFRDVSISPWIIHELF